MTARTRCHKTRNEESSVGGTSLEEGWGAEGRWQGRENCSNTERREERKEGEEIRWRMLSRMQGETIFPLPPNTLSGNTALLLSRLHPARRCLPPERGVDSRDCQSASGPDRGGGGISKAGGKSSSPAFSLPAGHKDQAHHMSQQWEWGHRSHGGSEKAHEESEMPRWGSKHVRTLQGGD